MNDWRRIALPGAEPPPPISSARRCAVRSGYRGERWGLLLGALLFSSGWWSGPVRADAELTPPSANPTAVAATHLSAATLSVSTMPVSNVPVESATTTGVASLAAADVLANSAEPMQPAAESTAAAASPATLTESHPFVTPPAESTAAAEGWSAWVDPQRLASTLQLTLTMTFVGLAPAVLLLTTSYVRISIVLAVLRQAFGTQQLLPLQVTTALAMFCTGFVMWPTWTTVHEQAVAPWMQGAEPPVWTELAESALGPIREFMVRQIDHQGNADDVHLFVKRLVTTETYPTSYDEVPFRALMPAFLLSELKTAFLIGFQIYLPFLVIDLVVAAVTTSMGMFMLPPTTVSLPLKLLLFVLVDGWRLLVEMLLNSFL